MDFIIHDIQMMSHNKSLKKIFFQRHKTVSQCNGDTLRMKFFNFNIKSFNDFSTQFNVVY